MFWKSFYEDDIQPEIINLSKNHVANLQWFAPMMYLSHLVRWNRRQTNGYKIQASSKQIHRMPHRCTVDSKSQLLRGHQSSLTCCTNLLSQGYLQYGIWFNVLKLCFILKMISTKLIKTNNSNQFAYWVTRHTKRTNTGFLSLWTCWSRRRRS